ncbi:MAG: hypothetical protein K2P78_03355, partial [Gemmataceae bacterium]|nr:hypothetical protein [Gemmataceae bacterium]
MAVGIERQAGVRVGVGEPPQPHPFGFQHGVGGHRFFAGLGGLFFLAAAAFFAVGLATGFVTGLLAFSAAAGFAAGFFVAFATAFNDGFFAATVFFTVCSGETVPSSRVSRSWTS